jgi:ATP synthase protein I
MSDQPDKTPMKKPTFAEEIDAKAARKIMARKSTQGVWFGFGMMGLVGWSVVVPTLLGAALGIWLDNHHPGKHPWTLSLLVVGLAAGCLNAWHWVAKEDKAMHDEKTEDDHE